jgi:hypothetical protein
MVIKSQWVVIQMKKGKKFGLEIAGKKLPR